MKKTIQKAALIVAFLLSTTVYSKPLNNVCLASLNQHIINSDTLILDDCHLNDQDLLTLATYLKAHKNIVQLYLMNNQIGDKGAVLLSQVKQLKIVELRNNQITHRGAKALAQSSIHMIDLEGNQFNKSKSSALAKNNNSQLKSPHGDTIIIA